MPPKGSPSMVRAASRFVLLALAVCTPVFATTRSWTGAVSANWSDGGNWNPSGAPAAFDSLAFPSGAPHPTMNNDLPAGFNVGPMDFQASYTLNGNALTLNGDVSV